ncbi:MAG: histidinol-phosphate transaminase [SAR324 cluster bacterium]|nr:histidinol-phosphate transaminase [SAR324 cluster bacterium]
MKNKILNIYQAAESPFLLAKRLGINEASIIKLNANENPYGCLPSVQKRLAKASYHQYPDHTQRKIKEYLSGYTNCALEKLIAGSGADEIIDLVCRLLLKPGDRVLIFPPCFPYYEHVLGLNNLTSVSINRTNQLLIDDEQVNSFDLSKVSLVIIASPNNPSGDLVKSSTLKTILDAGVYVLLDEAYYEFSKVSCQEWQLNYPNLIICRTLSKMFGLAGLRLGYGIMEPNLAKQLHKIKPPYNITIAAEEALIASIDDLSILQQQLVKIIKTRDLLFHKLTKIPEIKAFKSEANFILFKSLKKNNQEIYNFLLSKGILTRFYDFPKFGAYIRVSVGTAEQMEIFHQELSSAMNN